MEAPATATTVEEIIVCRNVHKWYGDFEALKGISITVKTGEVIVIIGPSGSGKSTFIRTINRLEEHQEGEIVVDGILLSHDIRNIAGIRREVGMVFQQFNLFPHLTVLENVTLAPIHVRKWSRDHAEEVAMKWLTRVGIPEQAGKYPGQLSGGQQQRVAIARALAHNPLLVLADEPTGNLDEETGQRVLSLLLELTRAAGKTLIMATHSPEAVPLADRVFSIHDGQLLVEQQASLEGAPAPLVGLVTPGSHLG
jgi:general L-amino acid transport system ATP-binding protein